MRIQQPLVKPVYPSWNLKTGMRQNAAEAAAAQAPDVVSLAEMHRVLTPALGSRRLEQLTAAVARGSYLPPSLEVSCGIVEEHLATT